MKQTILAKQERPLLVYALSKLNPDVFSHPVWLRFGNLDPKFLPTTIDDLTQIAQELQKDNLKDSCRLLLICAAYQNQIGQHSLALLTLRQVSALASQSGLTAESLWAFWGACAICFQQEEYSQATAYLEDLQTALDEKKEWVLAGFLDVIKQCLCQFASEWKTGQHGEPENDSTDEFIRHTFLCLQDWGSVLEIPNPVGNRWQLHWLMPSFIQKVGENLRADRLSARLDISVWQSIKSLLRLQAYRTNTKTRMELTVHQDDTGPNAGDENHTAFPSTESQQSSNTDPPKHQKRNDVIPVVVQMLGQFSIAIQDSAIKSPASRGLSLLKYLLLHHKQDTPREVLMDTFWPDADPEAARNNLNVALHGLRQVLRSVTDVTIIRFEDGAHGLAPNLEIWLDVEEYDRCIKDGQRLEIQNQLTAAVTEYEIAVNLYRGDFLVDTPYESWTVLERERLRISYIDTLDHLSQIYFTQERYAACVALCQLILPRDLCREDVHCRLMQCFSRLGQGSLALRQYQVCEHALRAELDVEPEPLTTQLAARIRRHERV